MKAAISSLWPGAVLAMVLGAMPAVAQSVPPQPADALTGIVKDVSGAVMQAVTVQVFAVGSGEDDPPIREAVTDASGRFSIALPPGVYRVEATAPAFTRVVQTVTHGPGSPPLEFLLDLDIVGLVVDVAPSDSLAADTMVSLTSTTIAGDDLLDLPRDEEELATYLLMLAGAELTGDIEEDILAHFVIDGFEDGRLPSPDQIAQIIVDPSTLRADGQGRPRIQIVTRPGTGRWRGSVDVGFADESLNARTPGEQRKEPRQTRDVEARIEAPLVPGRLEMTVEVSSGIDERAADSLRAITSTEQLFRGVVRPERQDEVQVGARLQLNQDHRLDVQVRGGGQRSANRGVGGFRLPERGSDRTQDDWSIQVSERMIRSNLTNNVRMQISGRASEELPVREGFAINVADAFQGGGGTSRSRNSDLRVRFDEELRLQRGLWNYQVGGQVQYQRRASLNQGNYNGTFEFASLHDYCQAIGFQGANCAATAQIVQEAQALGVPPVYLDARGEAQRITGAPTTFTQAFGNAALTFTQVSFNSYVQADRRFGERASLGFGLRYEATNHSLDFLRVNPSVSLQYRITPATVVSAGARLGFQDFNDRERLIRNDGSTYQSELVISSPSFPDPLQGGEVEYGSNTASWWVLDPEYRSPYGLEPEVSVRQEVPGNLRVTVSYNHGFGWRQRRTRNVNAPYPGTPLPDEILDLPRDERQAVVDQMRPLYPYVGNVTQIETTGRSESRTFRIQVQPRRAVTALGLNLSGNVSYVHRRSHDDNDFNNPYVPEWGLARRDHELQSQFRVRLPNDVGVDRRALRVLARATYQGVNLNFNLRANTGRLYSISSGTDLNGDQSNRDRPIGVARNTAIGPGSWNLDMTFTKELRLSATQSGGGGRRDGGGNASNRRSIRFQARVNNLLNRSQPRGYGSVVTSPLFGLPTGYTGGRTVNLSMRLAF